MNKKVRARDKRLFYFYDNEGLAHLGTILGGNIKDDASRLAFFTFDKGVLSVVDDQNGNKCAIYNKTQYQLKDGMPLPVYNDGQYIKGLEQKPNLVEKIGLYKYQKLFTRFYAGNGITMIEASKSIDIKNNLLKSRMDKINAIKSKFEENQTKQDETNNVNEIL